MFCPFFLCANKCVDVAGSHCYYADNGTATCTAAGHIYC